MREAFLQYIGNKDDLTGYRRSNRLVLLKIFFVLLDEMGKAPLTDVVRGYINFYKSRKQKGLVTDIGADVAIKNIESATEGQVLAVIKRHPYRVLNEKGYLTIVNINNQEYFALNELLNESLSKWDIDNIIALLDEKLSLYYFKIDELEQDREYIKEYNNNDATKCKLTEDVKIKWGSRKKYKKVKVKKLKSITSDREKTIGEVNDIEVCKHEEGILVSSVFQEGIFKNFNEFCSSNQIIYLRDLKGFNFDSLLQIRGFGVTRVKKITDRYKEVVDIDSTENEKTKHVQKLEISNRMRDRIEHLIELDYQAEANDDFTDKELIILNKFEYAAAEVGVEICQVAYLYPEKVSIITNVLEVFASNVILQEDRLKKMNCAFEKINVSNKEKKVYPLVMSYTTNKISNNELINTLKDYLSVFDLVKAFPVVCKNYEQSNELIKFMEWLQTDFKELILYSYLEVFKKDSYKEVIDHRAKGETLESTGKMMNLTRERVRQIEKKVQIKFDWLNNRKCFMWLISALANGETMISKDVITNNLSNFRRDDLNSFIYLLINSNSQHYSYSNEINTFIIGEEVDFIQLNESLDNLPDIIYSTDLNIFLDNIFNKVKANRDIVQKALENTYKLSGQVYHKRKISLTEMYGIVLLKYYPTGIKLFEEAEQQRFRRYIFEMFGNVKLPHNKRALDARVADIGVLCDRGTYIHSNYIKINQDLIEEIRDYINNSERNSYLFLELFEVFKDKLMSKSNINNRYFLQGILKYYYNTEFYFTRDLISKSSQIDSIDSLMEEFVGRHDSVTKEQLRKEFDGITEAMLFFAIGRCKNIIVCDHGQYMHTKHLNIKNSDYKMSDMIESLTMEMPVSSRKLLEVLYTDYNDFLIRNSIYSHTKLFSILQYMFGDNYRFSRPFIAKIDAEDTTNMGIVKSYLNDRNSFEISELIEFCEKNRLKFLSWTTLIDNLSDQFLRCDKDLCININDINIDEDKIESIKENIKSLINQKGYISARKIKDFMLFPSIGVEWNGYILKSIVEKYVMEINVLQITTSDTYLLTAIFMDDYYSNFDSYEEFLRSVIKSEHNEVPFRDLDEVRQWLQEEELINNNIPKFMFDNNYLYTDEFGKLIVE